MTDVWIELKFEVEALDFDFHNGSVVEWDIYLPNGERANWLKEYLSDDDFDSCMKALEDERFEKSQTPSDYRPGVGDF